MTPPVIPGHNGHVNPQAPGSAMIALIERMVLDPNASIERLERLIQLRDREEQRQREREQDELRRQYYAAKAACQADLRVVVKNRVNAHTRSSYADLTALAEQADPIIHRHGFTLSFSPDGRIEGEHLRLCWEIAHTCGYVVSGVAQIPVVGAGLKGGATMTAIHAWGSTVSYGRRYLKLMLFDIATGDDTDGATPPVLISEQQCDELRELMDRHGTDIPKFCRHYNIAAVSDLPAAKLAEAKAAIVRASRLRQHKSASDMGGTP